MDHDPNHSAASARSGDQLVADRLAHEAARLDIGTPMVEVVIERGRQRQQRRRTVVGVLSVAVVCAAAIVTINVLSRPADQRAVTAPGETPLPANGTASAYTPARLVESNLEWSRFEPESAAAVSFLNGTAELTGDGPYVAWSTAPGTNSGRATMWRSDDGLSWQQVDDVPVFSSANVVQHNGRLLAFGTAPATASTIGGRSVEAIASSDDGGITWSTQTLALASSDLEDEPGVASVTTHATSISAGPAGVMAVVRQSVNLDVDNLVPADARRYGYTTTPSGVKVFGPNQCDDATIVSPAETTAPAAIVTETTAGAGCAQGSVPVATTIVAGVGTIVPSELETTLTWAELGISDRAAAASLNPEIRMFFSADGATFDEVSSPVVAGSGHVDLRLTDTDDGFVASVVTYDEAGTSSNELFHTSDGQSWTAMGRAPLAFAEGFAALDDRLVMSTWVQDPDDPTSSTTAVAVRDPNGTWTTTLLNDLVLPSDGAVTSLSGGGLAVGPDGITMLAMLFVDPVAEMGGVEVSRNGITMQVDALGSSRWFVDQSGTELGSVEHGSSTSPLVVVDPRTSNYQVRRTEDGEVVATFTEDDIYSQLPVDAVAPTSFILHSADGVAWSRESIDDIAGAPVSGTGGIRVTDTQVIVAANLAGQKNADGTPRQILLLGTPKS